MSDYNDVSRSQGHTASQWTRDELARLDRAAGGKTHQNNYAQMSQRDKRQVGFQLRHDRQAYNQRMATLETGYRSAKKQQAKTSGWMSKWEIGAIECIPQNLEPALREAMIDELIDGAPVRAHERVNLAAKGHKQYWWVKQKTQEDR